MPDHHHLDEFEIKVPASIANLGPGFDTLGLAVQLYLRLHVKRIEGENELRFRFLEQPLDGENSIERAFRYLSRQQAGSFPSVEVEVTSDIPMKAGLGSSAAATVAGLRLYEALISTLPRQTLLTAATALEGHPDNAAAALCGGFTASCQLSDGSIFAAPLHWPEEVSCIVLTPAFAVATSAARQVLPGNIPRQDAVFNLQHLTLLIHTLASGDYSLLAEALHDRMHQTQRMSLMPGLKEVLALRHPDLLGVCLSGAGPSVVAFAKERLESVEALLASTYTAQSIPYTIRRLTVHPGEHGLAYPIDRPTLRAQSGWAS
jgi:homoserine kinase